MRGATEGKQAYGSNEQFQSTRPVRGATGELDKEIANIMKFQSTRPVRGATPGG